MPVTRERALCKPSALFIEGIWMLEVIMLAIGTNFDYPPIKGEELSFQTVDGRRELSTMIELLIISTQTGKTIKLQPI
jgi:hypothetical protein